MVDKKVFLVTIMGDILSYDLDTSEWVNFSSYWTRHGRIGPFEGKGEIVEDTIYAIYSSVVTALRPPLCNLEDVGSIVEQRGEAKEQGGKTKLASSIMSLLRSCPVLVLTGNQENQTSVCTSLVRDENNPCLDKYILGLNQFLKRSLSSHLWSG